MSGDRSTATTRVVGATGCVGGRLVPLLASRGYRVRAMGRSLDKILTHQVRLALNCECGKN
jgi:nucleoside-diphosphate-sugar epimerase